jgi:adenylate cyclase
MGEKKALDRKCELVHILARWTWLVLLIKNTNVHAFVLDSNRFFTHRKGA